MLLKRGIIPLFLFSFATFPSFCSTSECPGKGCVWEMEERGEQKGAKAAKGGRCHSISVRHGIRFRRLMGDEWSNRPSGRPVLGGENDRLEAYPTGHSDRSLALLRHDELHSEWFDFQCGWSQTSWVAIGLDGDGGFGLDSEAATSQAGHAGGGFLAASQDGEELP
jgi:hypothetical protein